MTETYFAIRVYVLYAMLIALGIVSIALAIIILRDNKKK